MSEPPATFQGFQEAFQKTLAQIILADRAFADQIGEVLEPEYFEHKYLQTLVRLIYEHRTEFDSHPSLDAIDLVVRQLEDHNAVVRTQLQQLLAYIKINPPKDTAFVKKQSLDFCKKQVLKKAFLESFQLMETCSFDEIKSKILHALSLGADNELGHDYIKDFEVRYHLEERNAISTGWPRIDNITKGGFGRGELVIGMGGTGGGKSMALVHLGAAALKCGHNVIYYTLELADSEVGRRFDSCLSSVPLDDLSMFKDVVLKSAKRVPGKLIIKEWPMKSVTVNSIRQHLEKVQKAAVFPDDPNKFGPIIVDYADLLKPLRSNREKRFELESIYEELRAVAQEFGCPVITVSQVNRAGLSKEIVTMEHMAEALNKAFPADFIFSLSRTKEQAQTNQGRMYVVKNRQGLTHGVYPLFFNPACVKIDVLEQLNDEELAAQEKEKMKRVRDIMNQQYGSK